MTSNDPYVAANRTALVGLYEAFTAFCEMAYDSAANISTLGQIVVTALNIPTDTTEAIDEAKILINLVASCFDADNPQYYFIANGYSFSYYPGAGGILYSVTPYVHLEYDAYAVRQNYNAIIENKFAEYQALADTVDSQYDKARLVHDKIVAERDYSNINGVPDTNAYAHNIIGVFDTTTNGPVCESYAKAYSYIMNRLGIETIYITGLGNGGGHAWNMVCLDGIWYYCDTTWDDRDTTENDPGNVINDVYYMYYMVGNGNTTFTSKHDAGDPAGTNGWFIYDEPVSSAADLDVNMHEFSYITDNGFYGNAVWSSGGNYKVKNNYSVTYSETFDYYRNLNDRNFGTYAIPASGEIDVTDIEMHLFTYLTFPTHIGPLVKGVDYEVVVEEPYVPGQSRVWIYGIGDTFRGIDFGWITIE